MQEKNTEKVEEVRQTIASLVSVFKALTGREIDCWSMTAQYDPMLSCSMMPVKWAN